MKDKKPSPLQTALTVVGIGIIAGILAKKNVKKPEILALIVVAGLAAGFFIDKKVQGINIKA